MTRIQLTDAELIEHARNGDMSAFDEILRRYQGLIYGLVYHEVRNFTDAQDIAQEAFVKAFRYLNQLDQPERFGAWLKSIVFNECRMWRRKNRPSLPMEEAELLPSYASIADESWRRGQRHADIRQAVDSLPEKSRLMVTLHYLSGLSHREIGEFLGLPANAVGQHLHRARRQLKEIMMAQIEEDYTMNKLPKDFKEQVLRRISLYPRGVDGMFVTADVEGGICGFIMSVGEPGSEQSLVTLWAMGEDMEEVVRGTLANRGSEKPKGRALESAVQLLKSLDAEIKQVVLRLADSGKCVATVDLKQGDIITTVEMRPSDAMGLAVRVNAPIHVEESVVDKGDVAEEGVSLPWGERGRTSASEWNSHLLPQDDGMSFVFKGWDIGLSPEDMIDTMHYHKNEEKGTFHMWIEAMPEKELTFDLNDHKAGIEWFFNQAQEKNAKSSLTRGGKRYRISYSMLGEDARVRVVPEAGNAESEKY